MRKQISLSVLTAVAILSQAALAHAVGGSPYGDPSCGPGDKTEKDEKTKGGDDKTDKTDKSAKGSDKKG